MTHHPLFDLPPDSTITLRSLPTGRTFTYRIRRAPLLHLHFHYVDFTIGHTNEATAYPLGRIFDSTYHHSPMSEIPFDSPISLAFAWYWRHRAALPPTISVETQENSQAA